MRNKLLLILLLCPVLAFSQQGTVWQTGDSLRFERGMSIKLPFLTRAQSDARYATTSGTIPGSRTISTTSPLLGGGDLSANRTFSIQVANGSQDGYLSAANWNTFNGKQAALSGTGFVKISGTTISYDNSTYLTTTGNGSGLTNLTPANISAGTAGINITGSAPAASLTGLGTGVATALGVNVGSAGAFVVNGGPLGTPSSGVATNLTGTATSLNIGGNAATATLADNSTLWGGNSYTASDSPINSFMLGWNGTGWFAASQARIQTFLGVTGGPFLPLTAGSGQPLSGDLYITKTSPILRLTRAASTNEATVLFRTAGSDNWALGLGSGAADSKFYLYNYGTSTNAITVDNSNNAVSFVGLLAVNKTGEQARFTTSGNVGSGGAVFNTYYDTNGLGALTGFAGGTNRFDITNNKSGGSILLENTGGTVTVTNTGGLTAQGAISGTSATFSGLGIFGGAAAINGSKVTVIDGSGNPQLSLANNSSNYLSMYVDNTGKTFFQPNGSTRLTLDAAGNAAFTGTVSASNLSGTNTGDQTSVTGNAGTATALQNARTIAGVSFDGTANISLNNNAITNGAGYITASSSDALSNKTGNISQWTNNSGYITSAALSGYAPLASPTFTGTVIVPWESFSSSWNGKLEPPTKDAIWDALSNGTYVATLTNTTNIDASTLIKASYQRIGTETIVYAEVEVEATAGGVECELRMTLPNGNIVSNATDLRGHGTTYDAVQQLRVTGVAGGGAKITWSPNATAPEKIYFSFMCESVTP